MLIPDNLRYSKTHEWVVFIDGKARVGLTDYAQDALGDIVFFNLPEIGAEVGAGDAVGEVESVKAVSEICAPVSGTVREVNEKLLDAPELVNSAPYEAWVYVVGLGEGAPDFGALLTPEQYAEFCGEEAHG